MKQNGILAILDDDEDILATARIVLSPYFEEVVVFEQPEEFLDFLKTKIPHVILLDMNFSIGDTSAKDGLSLLKQLQDDFPSISVVTSTAYGDIELAVDSIKKGASDFVVKPWDNDKLIATMISARELSFSKQKVESLESKQKALLQSLESPDLKIIGDSPQIQSVLRTIEKVAQTDANVLILGENGTGKSLAAKIIHQQSSRSDKPFIHVDLGSLSETLFESEMFGHKKGAFTDAHQDRIGRFELSDQGTLFLDEIGNLSIGLQAKLLTTIEQRHVIPLGSNTVIPVDTRLISATNSSIYELVKTGQFREDLVYRLNTIEITIPPLRERVEDIPLLADESVKQLSKKYGRGAFTISQKGMAKLKSYAWPGNVRELNHVIERAIILADSHTLKDTDFPLTHTEINSMEKPKRMDDIEKESIVRALTAHQGNMTKVAKELGMARNTLYRKIEKYGI